MPLSPTATRDLLAQLGHSPKQFLGQNFLVDGNIVRKSLALAEVQPGDTVVEVGPGLGTLTSALLEAGAEVWAIEKDRTLHAYLEAQLLPRFPGRLHLMEGDALEHPLAGQGRAAARAAASPASVQGGLKVVANLPYAIATPWLDAVLEGPLPLRMVLMLQQEAAQRYAARIGTKSLGAISIFFQAAYEIMPGHKVAAACFYPRPDVASQLLNVVRKPVPFLFPREIRALIRSCFQQRRKQIGALLRARLSPEIRGWGELLEAHGLSEQTRPEAIPVEFWMRLSTLSPALA